MPVSDKKTSERQFILHTKSQITIHLIDGEKAIEEFSKKDAFINSMSPFDLESRLNMTPTPSIDEYVSFITKQILPWSDACAAQVESVINELNTNSFDILKHCKFPSPIYIILTNGKDESDAAYCRNDNLIILPLNSDTDVPYDEITSLTNGHEWNSTIKHELFHIWSRNNIQLRDAMYKIIGYNTLSETVKIPEDVKNLKITNPDACITEHSITLKRQNNENINVAPILIASKPYSISSNPNFFEYVTKLFVVLDENFKSTDELLSYDDVIGLRDNIGNNTNYIIHPEEVLADNFVLLLNHTFVPDQWILDHMKSLLAENKIEICL